MTFRVFGIFAVACLCAGFLSLGKESHPSAAMSRFRARPPIAVRSEDATTRSKETRVTLLRYADIYRDLGDYPTAEAIVKELLSSIENSPTAEAVDTAIGLVKLGSLCADQGKYGEANAHYQRALAIIDQSHGAGFSNNLPSPKTQVDFQSSQEFYPPSEVIYQRLLSFLARRAGHEQPAVAVVLRELAELYRHQGKIDDAATYYDYALAILRITLGADHPEYRFTSESYVQMQGEQERLPLKDSCCDEAAESLGPALQAEIPIKAIAIP